MTESALSHAPQGRLRAGWRAVLFILLLVISAAVAGALAAVVATAIFDRPLAADPGLRLKLFSVLAYGATALAALGSNWVMLRFVDRTGWSYVDLERRAASAGRLALGFVAGALAIGIPCVALIALGWLTLERTHYAPLAPATETLLALAILIPAALAEELMMRGYLLSVIAEGIGRWWALVLTSVLFALLHFRNPGMTPAALAVVALAGIFLGTVRFATRSLYAAWAAHLAWNVVLGVALHALVSGTLVASARWQTLDSGPDWATGGAWGPEGGLAAVLGLLAATSLLIIRRPRVAGPNDTTTA